MSSDFYFQFWTKTLDRLKKITDLDHHYQNTKYHDQKRCEAAQCLTGVLALYHSVYKDLVECGRNNLQVQKIGNIDELVKDVVARITELNHTLRKLEASQHRFFGQSLQNYRITTNDTELNEVPNILERPEFVEKMIEEAFEYARMKKEEEERLAKEKEVGEVVTEEVDKWWETEVEEEKKDTPGGKFGQIYEVKEQIDEETLKRRGLVALIQAHEKTRRVTKWSTQRRERRVLWTKELMGERNPEARLEIKERCATLIQKAMRTYFKLKRKKIQDFRRDELLGLDFYKSHSKNAVINTDKIHSRRLEIRKKYLEEWKTLLEIMKQKQMNKKGAEIAEDFRDGIREWFLIWYTEVKTFYDIPNDRNGGSIPIVKEEVPTPLEWWEQYQSYLKQLRANKNKSAETKRLEKIKAKKDKKEDITSEKQKKLMAEEVKKKLMKNPKSHPGFQYPKSERTEDILKAIANYKKDWSEYDATEAKDVKEKYVKSIIRKDAIFEINMQVRPEVDADMRKELLKLKKSLKRDYAEVGEKVPEIKIKQKRPKKEKLQAKDNQNVVEIMKDLAVKGILKNVPKTKITDFIGDQNYAGDEYRCLYKPATPFAGEVRNLWWDRCREVANGHQAILLVGTKGSGKTMLVHAMAAANNACLIELNPATVTEFLSSVYIENLMKNVIACAKAAQPTVVYVRDVHRLFYRKVPPEEKDNNLDMLHKYLIRFLFKKIQKKDNITVVGACVDPWLTKSRLILKKFPHVVLLPNTNYSTVVQILKDWVLSYHTLPRKLDIHSLAYMLQGYSFQFLKEALNSFMTADTIVQSAARDVNIQDIYNYILDLGNEKLVDYTKYLKWYTEKTPWGQKERNQLQAQLQFQALAAELELKKKKKRKPRRRRSSRSSKRGSRSSRLSTIRE